MSLEKGNEGEAAMIEAKRREFLDGAEDDLKDLGFMDSDEEIDFSNFKIGRNAGKTADDEDEEEEVPSMFGRLTSAFQNYTGNKTLTKADVDPVLKEFSDSLTDKNVSAEIAQEICKSVREILLDTKTASFTSIK